MKNLIIKLKSNNWNSSAEVMEVMLEQGRNLRIIGNVVSTEMKCWTKSPTLRGHLIFTVIWKYNVCV